MKLNELLTEIEIGGGVEREFIDDIDKNADYTHPQKDLFPDIPTLDPHLPKKSEYKMEIVGTIGTLRVVKTDLIISAEQKRINRQSNPNADNGVDYVLFDKNKPIGWAGILIPPKNGYRLYMDGISGQVVSVYIDESHRGSNLGLKLYHWILTHVCDYLVMDELQTMGGVKLWKRALNSKAFDVMVSDKRNGMSRRRWAGKDFGQVYNDYGNLIPWMTLAGKADELMYEE